MTEIDFFENFDKHHWDLVYADEAHDDQPVVQVGIVAAFYMKGAYTPLKRMAIAEAFKIYCQLYEEKLNWGYMGGETITTHEFSATIKQKCITYTCSESPSEPVSFMWSSAKGFNTTGDFLFQAFSPADWFEQIHHALSVVRVYLPIDALRENASVFDTLIKSLCRLLEPLHGSAGFGIQNCHEHQNYQHTEREILSAYRGVDLSLLITNESWRTGYVGLNWYTYINNDWISSLTIQKPLTELLKDTRIIITEDAPTTIIKAGNWPALGKSDTNPLPELYVKVNEVIKPLRVTNIGSLHYGSTSGEIRLNVRTSNLWMRRFDLPPGHSTPATPRKYYRYSTAEMKKMEEDRLLFDSFLNGTPSHYKP
ncbi:DUF3396 domain-containing protein [Pseudomonas peradeniyensis]|uniref:type VI immunity family protein n=1 Tax=Pseudomonas TaxID=286 RepID=UPI0009E7B46A|nr:MULTISPECIES: type VI immunity family protein [Pseudomonas]MCU7281098.1 DUF3396 domain-containing protein [Pseudomonas peradeniyensis]QZA52782.1 DUF3396 domain-containing protein [Pseudomonas sp. 2hn]